MSATSPSALAPACAILRRMNRYPDPDEAYRRRARERERDQTMTNLRALAWLAQQHQVDAVPVRIERGHRGKPSVVTLTFHIGTVEYGTALRAVRDAIQRREQRAG